MTQPPLPPQVPDWAESTPEWTPPAAWAPPVPASPPAPAAPVRSRGPLSLAAVALVGVVAGSVAATLLVTAVFVGSAKDIGREMGQSMGEEMNRSMEDAYLSMEESFAWGGGMPVAPEDVAEPVPPVTGPDPVLNAYAQACFEGDYQSCDDLYFESPPLSDYEEYGSTCAGRVKIMSVMACTDLD
jgi:hypothetical protein